MDVRVSSNALQVAHDVAGLAERARTRVRAVVEAEGIRLQTQVRANASGRPGPRAQTGDYRRSITRQTSISATGIRVEVGTNSPQGRRLEFGFWGMRDSLGRLFHQSPYPHFGPAADVAEARFPAAIERVADELAGGGR